MIRVLEIIKLDAGHSHGRRGPRFEGVSHLSADRVVRDIAKKAIGKSFIKQFVVSRCKLEGETCAVIASLIRTNPLLELVDISEEKISNEGMQRILEAIRISRSLHTLKIYACLKPRCVKILI